MPHGYGYWGAYGGQAGIIDGGAFTASVTQGFYVGETPSTGFMGTGGAVARALGSAVELPGGTGRQDAGVIGLSAPGFSFGGMVTNAQSVVGHKETFDNVNVSVSWFNFTYAWDPKGSVYQINFGLNVHPANVAVSRYNTYTVVSPSGGCSGR